MADVRSGTAISARQNEGMSALKIAALSFAALALTAGGLQLLAYASGGWVRHLVVGVFACSVGISVAVGVVASALRSRR